MPLIKATHTLRDEVARLITEQESIAEHVLSLTERSFLAATLEDFIVAAAAKYVHGSKHYGDGFLTEVDHIREAKVENIDLLFYLAGADYRKKKGSA